VPEIRPPVWKTLTRAGILVGMICMLIGLAVHNILEGVNFANPIVLGPFAAGAVLFVVGIAVNIRWLLGRIAHKKFLVGLNL